MRLTASGGQGAEAAGEQAFEGALGDHRGTFLLALHPSLPPPLLHPIFLRSISPGDHSLRQPVKIMDRNGLVIRGLANRVSVDEPNVLQAAISEVVHLSLSIHVDHGDDDEIRRRVLH